MMGDFSDHVRSAAKGLSRAEIAHQPITSLLGVTEPMAFALAPLGVVSVRDLARSRIFLQAKSVLDAADNADEPLPGDLLSDDGLVAPALTPGDLPLARLHGLAEDAAAAVAAALGTPTIREFALWGPRRAAGAILDPPLRASDENGAERLRPEFGTYPTENVYYSSIVMLGTAAGQPLQALDKPLSLNRVLGEGAAFGQPAIGAIATYVQSWFAQGITLGQMLHSLALAPGEATRIAVLDWTRKTSATVSEEIGETERLSNTQTHGRAISEVQSAVASDVQEGKSDAFTTATSSSDATASAYAGGAGFAMAGFVIGGGGAGSSTHQEATTDTTAGSTSWTKGTREVLAGMSQHVNDRTEQRASSVRSRRASSVREVSQSEHEQVSTRIVANYNHMHALTIQYYEVVQVYRVSAALHKFTRAIFLPFQLLDFTDDDAMDMVGRFRPQLLRAALTRRARELLIDDRGTVEISGAIRVQRPVITAELHSFATIAAPVAAAATGAAPATGGAAAATPPATTASPRPAVFMTLPGPLADIVPGDATLASISFEDVGISRIRVDREGFPASQNTFEVSQATGQIDFPDDLLIRQVASILAARSAGDQSIGNMVMRFRAKGQSLSATVPLTLASGQHLQRIAYVTADAADRREELLAHLQDNRAYYTRTVFETLDSATLVSMLTGISFEGRSLVDQIEPRIVAVMGNYLVLPAPVEDAETVTISGVAKTWAEHKNERGADRFASDRRLISIPTGGVFAEAVLGRSNSAEKLDMTRFWNWQDSPIPLTPPDIAPVGLNSRAQAETLTPGQLSSPILNIMNPTNLPDPAGLNAVLTTLANGQMFRDMSGLAGTQNLANSASANTLAAATEAGRMASANMGTAARLAATFGLAAVDAFKASKGAGGSGDEAGEGGAAKNAGISGHGAKFNLAEKIDALMNPTGGGDSAQPTRSSGGGFAPDIMPGVDRAQASRVLEAFDMATSGVSPGLIGELQATLASGAGLVAASLTLPTAGSILDKVLDGLDWLILGQLERDCVAAGIDLKGAKLFPMRDHRHGADFTPLYGAWTNSADHVFVVMEGPNGLRTSFVEAIDQGASPEDAALSLRRDSLFRMFHEASHIVQFSEPPGGPPASFKAMLDFEIFSYGAEKSWVLNGGWANAITALDPQLVVTAKDVADTAASIGGFIGQLNTMLANATAVANPANPPSAAEIDAKVFAAMKLPANAFLPASIVPKGGTRTASYNVADLYDTPLP